MTDLTKAKIIELVHGKEYINILFNVSLADVLRAIEKSDDPQWAVYATGEFMKWGDTATSIYWNFLIDYDGQSEEVKTFIGSLLGI